LKSVDPEPSALMNLQIERTPCAPSPRKVLLAVLGVALGTAAVLAAMGRIAWCGCGSWSLWAGDIWSRHTSQHLLDPYSFSHYQHGLVFYALLWWLLRGRVGVWGRGGLAIVLEAGWEILENSPLVIERYRAGTISADYTGDAILNSMGDLLCCGAGYLTAAWAPAWASVALFLVIEGAMVLLLRDSLLLNVLMLLAPNAAIRAWQQGG